MRMNKNLSHWFGDIWRGVKLVEAFNVTTLKLGGTAITKTAAEINGLAPLASPTFTGTVTLPATTKIQDTSADHTYTLAVNELDDDRVVTLPLLTGADEFTFNDHEQTLTNKTLTSPVLTTPQINDTSLDHQYVVAVNELAADRNVTLPLLTGDDEFTFNDHTQTLANKTLNAAVISDKTPVNAIAAIGTLTSVGAMAAASHAESEIESDTTNNAQDETITIGSTVYRWRNTLAQAYDVKIGVSAAASLDNLKAAINATGTPGTEYFAGTLAHPDVVADDNSDTIQKIVARVPGSTVPNAIATTEACAHLAWADTTLGGAGTSGGATSVAGVTTAAATVTIEGREYMFVTALSETAGATAIVDQVLYGGTVAAALDNLKLAIDHGATEGTEYSTGTVVNAHVIGSTNAAASQIVIAIISGVVGNALTLASTVANMTWDGAGVMGGTTPGSDGTVGNAFEIQVDTGYIYICTAANTIADANWKSVAIT